MTNQHVYVMWRGIMTPSYIFRALEKGGPTRKQLADYSSNQE